ncbi:hypothetical protein [Gloeothece verrucosa]|uniref:Uncharacterized protein n=1 Tax=Gloeothece verrucosa (strain PCC 7822) TaxID=497965 RepID=E0UMQ4_GLOV7|nr:hypothetical protein [Gloeothece verrucosa]ADN18234.1 hypothetical protein Cyan7822_6451 [Gloeothece verrucosa PCC 7822]
MLILIYGRRQEISGLPNFHVLIVESEGQQFKWDYTNLIELENNLQNHLKQAQENWGLALPLTHYINKDQYPEYQDIVGRLDNYDMYCQWIAPSNWVCGFKDGDSVVASSFPSLTSLDRSICRLVDDEVIEPE